MTNNYVRLWLLTGVIMIFIQIIIGGVTRLTGSGLSITKWEIVTGTIPPLDEVQWNIEFNLYKETPQYQKINAGMDLKDFKFIYFWEYIHRLWARIMGLVFIIPFLYFYSKDYFNSQLKKRLIIVFLLATTVASFGWIMVASGLVDRPWVNAYKLALHLSLAIITLVYLFWVYIQEFNSKLTIISGKVYHYLLVPLSISLALQLFLGGVMSGVKAALVYPTWPDLHGEMIPSNLIDLDNWNWVNFIQYDQGIFFSGLIQLLHRSNGYLLFILASIFITIVFFNKKYTGIRLKSLLFFVVLIVQILLGIGVLIYSIGIIPVGLGVAHQAIGILLTLVFVSIFFNVSSVNSKIDKF